MSIIPGFRFQFCFTGESAAKEQAFNNQIVVIFWKEGKRCVAIPSLTDGAASFPFDTRDECYVIYSLLQKIGYSYGNIDGVTA